MSFFHIEEDLATDVALFTLGLNYGCSGSGLLLSDESDGITQFRQWEVRPEVADLLLRRVVLLGRYSHS